MKICMTQHAIERVKERNIGVGRVRMALEKYHDTIKEHKGRICVVVYNRVKVVCYYNNDNFRVITVAYKGTAMDRLEIERR